MVQITAFLPSVVGLSCGPGAHAGPLCSVEKEASWCLPSSAAWILFACDRELSGTLCTAALGYRITKPARVCLLGPMDLWALGLLMQGYGFP
jgi:hypothetical protein